MQSDETKKAQIEAEAGELMVRIMDALAAHGSERGMLDPQVVLSALGSSVVGLFCVMRANEYPPSLIQAYATVAEAYFQALPDQIAAAIAGKAVPTVAISAEIRGHGTATHKGGRA